MLYKKFYLAVILRLVLIILLSMATCYLFFMEQSFLFSALLFIFLIAAVVNIIRYFNRINQWISAFLLGIENDDTTLKAPAKTGNKAIDDVYTGISRLNEIFRQIKSEINVQEQYFRMVIDQSATGLFSVNETGRVINVNPAATKLTKLYEHHHINTLQIIDAVLPGFIMQSFQNSPLQSAIFENQYGQKLLFKLSEIKTGTESIKLVAVSDITKELDNREIDAWVKLARTLSHEIMNNIAPITTLSKVISGYYVNQNKTINAEEVDSVMIANTVKGLRVIEERGLGLISFIENYRKFTKLPVPKFSEVNISKLIESNLMAASAYPGFNSIKTVKHIPPDIIITTDEKLLSQVILNLLKNASEALQSEITSNPLLQIRLLPLVNAVKIEVSNNGPKIPPEMKEQIFVPFFTTKENGSGIGLSLSKQIILQMGGDIVLNSGKEEQTTFTILINSASGKLRSI